MLALYNSNMLGSGTNNGNCMHTKYYTFNSYFTIFKFWRKLLHNVTVVSESFDNEKGNSL